MRINNYHNFIINNQNRCNSLAYQFSKSTIQKNNVIYFRGGNDFDIKAIASCYFEQNKPPANILNIGLHGSSSTMNIKPHSDIDFYCICKKQDEKSIQYLRGFVEHINKNTNRWVDMMVGHLKNDDAFKLNSFVLNDILKNSVNLHGKNLTKNIAIMLKNYKGESSSEYLYKELKTSGHRIKRAIVDLNQHQVLISKPPFSMDGLRENLNGIEIKAKTIAKQILASCSFANTILELDSGIIDTFSKKDAPKKFKKYFKLKTNLPLKAKKIYYEDSSNIDLDKFANIESLKWLKIQETIEQTLLGMVKKR